MKTDKTFKVMKNTSFKDLRKGDLVVTGEIHRIVGIFDKKEKKFSVVTIEPECEYCKRNKLKCGHEHIMGVGYGQQNILKIVK